MNKLFVMKKLDKRGMTGQIKSFLMLIILALIISAVWISQVSTVYSQVYTGLSPQNISYTVNGTTATAMTPSGFVSPSILVQILGLIPLGLWLGVAFVGFKMFTQKSG